MSLLDQLIEAMPGLYEREREIIEMRLGINGDQLSPDDAGVYFSISGDQVRKIEDEVLARLGICPKNFKPPGLRLHRRYLKDYLKDLEALRSRESK
jgi:DNA-directed RNA polymerase sigma subunit (sigma70/sigma32)